MTPLNRRNLIRTTLWTAPAITVASAAPAVAASPTGRLEFVPGGTYLDEWTPGGYDLAFQGASIEALGNGAGPAQLTMTITATDDAGQPLVLFNSAPPTTAGYTVYWTGSDTGTFITVTYVYPLGINTGDTILIDDAVVVGMDESTTRGGTFTIVVSAAGFTSGTWTTSFSPSVTAAAPQPLMGKELQLAQKAHREELSR